jgi:hypothetical protein
MKGCKMVDKLDILQEVAKKEREKRALERREREILARYLEWKKNNKLTPQELIDEIWG